MPAQLTLLPQSSAAGEARRWVKQSLTERSRTDLLESAVLGVSELVTNALLHVRGTIEVRIVDLDDDVRIEVCDDSPRGPGGHPTLLVSRNSNPSTIGRGLQIVDSISHSWGVAYEDDGKCVWFRPMPDESLPSDEQPVSQEPGDADAQRSTGSTHPGEAVRVELIDVPIRLLAHYRTRFRDLRRELTLIALDDGEPSNVGDRLNGVAHRLESYRHVSIGAARTIDQALSAGHDRTTVDYQLPVSAIPGLIELRDLLREADEFCRAERLLTLAAGPQESALRDWYIGEFIVQSYGAAPTPWPGAFVVTDPDPLV